MLRSGQRRGVASSRLERTPGPTPRVKTLSEEEEEARLRSAL